MSNDCKVFRELCEKFNKLVTAIKEHRTETKKANESPKPEEIEMEVFWKRPFVTFQEPAYEERWTVIRHTPAAYPATKPIDIPYPIISDDWIN